MDTLPLIDRVIHRDLSVDTAIEALFRSGFELGERQSSQRTVLDTFDGRLHAAGMRLEHHSVGTRQELVLTAAGTIPARVITTAVPRWATDTPRGPFRARLAPVVEVRALLPLLTFTDTWQPAIGRDRTGKTIVTLMLHVAVGVVPWSIEVVRQPGHAAAAQRAVDLLLGLGFDPVPDDLASAVMSASGVAAHGHRDSPTVALSTVQPGWTGWRDVLLNLAESARANWRGTIDDIDTEFLHELRVALRRSRSILGQAHGVLPSSLREHFGDELRWLAGITGPTRDLDVYILEWDRYTAELTDPSRDALEPVLKHLRDHRRRAHAEFVAALRSDRASTLLDTWTAALTALAEPAADDAPKATDEIGHVVAARIRRTHQRLLDDARTIDADTAAERLHELRKDAKKLRYLVECFGSLIPTHTAKRFVKQMKGLQDNLGEHQDAEVHAAEIHVVAAELSDEHAARTTLVALGQLSQQLDATKARARGEFATRLADFDSKRTAKVMDSMLEALRVQ